MGATGGVRPTVGWGRFRLGVATVLAAGVAMCQVWTDGRLAGAAEQDSKPPLATGEGEQAVAAEPTGPEVGVGAKAIPTPPAGAWGIVSSGGGGGGIFRDADGGAEAWLGTANYGIQGFGTTAGGYFSAAAGNGFAYVGSAGSGVSAGGSSQGGVFALSGTSTWARLATEAHGSNLGVWAQGTIAGGEFIPVDATSSALIGVQGGYGVSGRGTVAGGYFYDSNSSGNAYLGYGNSGVYSYGSAYGVEGHSTNGYGVYGTGDVGGHFCDGDTGNCSEIGYSYYKVFGAGSVSFVQNHPTDPGVVIVYAAPEGDEVATYTRGTARLEEGEARVSLGETFKWVTDPDIGLTTYLTPVGSWCDLYVGEKGTETLVVRSRDGSDCTFDYLVYGLRVGFEEATVVQEKQREAFIPSMEEARELVARRPELARYTALARYEEQRHALGSGEPVQLAGRAKLVAAIHEYDPAVDRIEEPQLPAAQNRDSEPESAGGRATEPETADGVAQGLAVPESRQSNGVPPTARGQIAGPAQDVYARSFRPAAGGLAGLIDVGEEVEAGDLLVIDRAHPGAMIRAQVAEDPAVAGVVAGDAGVVLGSEATPDDGPRRVAVAFSGIAACKVDASYGPVQPGDLLVSSPTPGHAMREDVPLPGTVVGKALEPLDGGRGTIQILVTLR